MSDVEFFGERFGMNPAAEYEWEMMEFASAAKGGADSDLLSGAAAVHTFLKAIIVADDWERFRATAKKNKATVKDHLMPVVVRAFTQTTERPTSLPSDSSAGQTSTAPNSAGDSSSEEPAYLRVVRKLEEEGRPDKAQMVLMAQRASAA